MQFDADLSFVGCLLLFSLLARMTLLIIIPAPAHSPSGFLPDSPALSICLLSFMVK
ncbi:hypothetical protein [Saccharibacillus kuerlensis]|uniref:hypothetical protein n=1 Tax=Saccharibacillus kuerlensis TaxID=459527 RepID=UPI0003A5F566|nr:hypothetical protein [Saccharibacillus kuerlensis]